jgi:cystathionine beta-synthase
MKVYNNILELIGKTPLVKLNRMVESNSATVYAKIEYLNPGGSVKDRIGLHMVKRAEEQGKLKPGATIVESTSGNTGLGLAIAAAVKGYRCVFTMPDKMSQEKIDMLKGFGAEVVITPTDVAHDSPQGYVEVAKRIARETPNALYIDQYSNKANPEAHYLTTGPEIWEDTDGKVDYFVAGAGTGGTISGAGKYLKEQAKNAGREVKIVCPDPEGSIYYDYFYNKKLIEPESYKVEGVGHDFLVDTLDFSVIDEIRQISDKDSFNYARRLAREEGIFSGGSSGTALKAALDIAKEVGAGKIVVVVIADSGDRYISKMYRDEWMRDMCFLDPYRRFGSVKDILGMKGNHVEFAKEDEAISNVTARMSKLGISQMPIAGTSSDSHLMVEEIDLLESLLKGNFKPNDPVKHVAAPLQGKVSLDDSVSKLEEVFSNYNVAVVVDNSQIVGIISKIDLVKYLANKK